LIRVFEIVADELTSSSASEITELIRTGSVSSVEVVEAYLRRHEELNPALNAIVTIAPEVLDRARESDAELSRGKIAGPLHGLPITIKDTIDTEGIRTTYGSRLFAGNVPKHDAVVVASLKAAGAIILGKTNVPEMASPYETDNPIFGRTNNPYDVTRTAGGSSGGEAAAIAARLSPAGVGSDLSGSLRVPAHFCGIAALKPTTGLIPMDGHIPRATGTLAIGACVGPMAARVKDLALLFASMAEKSEDASRQRTDWKRGRVAWYADDGVAPVDHDVLKAVEKASDILIDAGYDVRQETPPAFTEGQRLWIELFSRSAREQMREIYRGREDEAGPLISPYLDPSYQRTLENKVEAAEAVAKAVVERERWREELLRWMKSTSLIVAPVCATPAFEHGAARVDVNRESISIFRSCSYSQTVNVFGLPAVVVPVARANKGLPIGVQIIGRPFQESEVLAAAAIIEVSAAF
jgi:Asp-tRNA(Asn)/Glu-tRNA(Gln) amidotransferase A subunit family amidase